MNPLTLVKRIQNINSREATLGISEQASWHAKYKDSAYVYVGGIPFDLTEGDLLAVFAQYGEIVDVNLVRDKGTGKSKGFAFIAYEDQRSTILAVDNLNGAQVLGRTIRVDHVSNYKKKEEEDEETERQKREARGVCRAFQRGECTRGAGCKFSHDEQRAANTGWGSEDKSARWGHENFEGPRKSEKKIEEGFRSREKDLNSILKGQERALENYPRESDRREEKRSGRRNDDGIEPKSGEDYDKSENRQRREERRSTQRNDGEFEPKTREDPYRRQAKRRHGDDEFETRRREVDDRKEDKRSRRRESEYSLREDRDKRGGKWSAHNRDSSAYHHGERSTDHGRSDR
ncbi:putative RNA recognition motif-containing protein [Tripterygium wilfordii]|uniref:Putative RNA recognition motif-containing protein n=1 Tax=Tripterygium wilfordii TaxID=458696 RepID=A0A7J7DEL8_TRIWF|nr:zinc finger CCCH domain-containing protein 25-like isoform X2 [Tripterygium wilfordii]KAF5744516.1 putative RNA recognition motif-containing protein [Tripterygium wilfordii]